MFMGRVVWDGEGLVLKEEYDEERESEISR